MKSILITILILFSVSLSAQEIEQPKMFSVFRTSALAGMNFSSLSGGSVVIEEKANLSSNLFLKLSVGYSTINKKEGYVVKTYGFINFDQYQYYTIGSYTVEEINYDVFPISLGLQYLLLHSTFSPYSLVEIGYNSYTFHTKTAQVYSYGNQYSTIDQVPAEYKSNPPEISKRGSYRIALGVGTTYKLGSGINLDIRYLYQFNKFIANTNQILVGINF